MVYKARDSLYETIGDNTHGNHPMTRLADDTMPWAHSYTPTWETLTSTFSTSRTEDAPHSYRILPIFSGIVIPFSVLLAIPSLTGRWYVRTGEKDIIIDSQPNTPLLETAMVISIVCAALAGGCLVVRFAERGVKPMTLLSILFLTIHDIISITTVTVFGVAHRFDDGFTYGQPFWMTVCSTLISTITNITLMIDYAQTPNFASSGSGLTRKQRSLVVIFIVLFFYIAIGALVQSILLKLSFIDALYFTVVSIETVGFGDIHPTTTGSRIFTMIYITFGILNLGVAVASTREALLEGIVAYLQQRIRATKQRERDRRVRSRWRGAIKWRLRAQRLPTWLETPQSEVHKSGILKSLHELWKKIFKRHDRTRRRSDTHRFGRHRRLNIEALTTAQLEAAALEAGAPLVDLLPPGFLPPQVDSGAWRPPPFPGITDEWIPLSPLTHIRISGMANLLASFALAVTHGEQTAPYCIGVQDTTDAEEDDDDNNGSTPTTAATGGMGVPMSRTLTLDGPALASIVESEEKIAFNVRLFAALMLFSIFWMTGSAIFRRTEGWSFGVAVYFCFVTFTTVGYGDFAPRTAAGRSIFVAWALLGVGTMTILVAILAEAYSARYRQVIHTEIYRKSMANGYQNQSTVALPQVSPQQEKVLESRASIAISRTNMASSSYPPLTSQRDAQQPFYGRTRAVSFAQKFAAFETEVQGGNLASGSRAARPPPLNLALDTERSSLVVSEPFRDEVLYHVSELRALVQASKDQAGLGVSNSTEYALILDPLQDVLEDIDRRLALAIRMQNSTTAMPEAPEERDKGWCIVI